MEGLNDRQERFCMEYITDLNATKAAERAGYADGSAYNQGSRLLADERIQARIAELQQDRAQRLQITQDRVLQELAAIAFSRYTDYVAIREKEPSIFDKLLSELPNPHAMEAVIKPSEEWTDDMKAAVSYITTPKGGGQPTIRLADKIKALEVLGKHLGMFTRKEINRE